MKVFRFIRHHEVAAYERVGWYRHDSLDGTHHGAWSSLMEWRGVGEPVMPMSRETVFHRVPHRWTRKSIAAFLTSGMRECK
jgi:hypothetical protein